MPRTNPSTGNSRNDKSKTTKTKHKNMPQEPTIVVPVAPSLPAPPSTNSSRQGDVTLQRLTGLSFPDALKANLPAFENLLNVADIASPAAFETAGWSRVTDAQRVEDKRAFRELTNYVENVQDGVKAYNLAATVAVATTEVGKNLIRYATGIEGMKTEAVKFQIQQAETSIAGAKLVGKQQDLSHQISLNQLDLERDLQLVGFRTSQNSVQLSQYQADLQTLQNKLEATLLKNQADLLDTANKYPQLPQSA
ncbi:hypothetical protein IFO70_30000 [Phormidium tenue FACHB-886]|nr:hypothetical protein [Phormidium tenue FACHB-886]